MSRDVAASIHQRLLNRARDEGRPFDELLQYFALERFLYRLGRSPFAGQFVLKGALMFGAWQGPFSRPTRDVDLLGHVDHRVEAVVEAMRTICQQPVAEDDGLRFDAESIVGETITEAAQYEGVRVRFFARLGTARIRLQVDTGFGDVLVPGPVSVRLPTMLDFPPPEVQGYTRESAIAEKFQAIVYLGAVNSRMKDFYDIWSLATRFAFEGPVLAQAIQATFRQRQTALQITPTAFTPTFADDPDRQAQWGAFIRRHPFEPEPPGLGGAIRVIAALLEPVVEALMKGRPLEAHWPPGGPWRR